MNDRVKVPSGSSLMSYIYDIVSVVYVDSCVVFGLPLIGSRDSVSETIFLLPGIYSISGLYSSSMSLHRNTLSVLKFLHVRFLWSVYI